MAKLNVAIFIFLQKSFINAIYFGNKCNPIILPAIKIITILLLHIHFCSSPKCAKKKSGFNVKSVLPLSVFRNLETLIPIMKH